MSDSNVLFNVKNAEMFELASNICEIFDSLDVVSEDETLSSFINDVKTILQKMTEAQKREKPISHSKEADRERDFEWRRVKRVISGYASNALEEIAEHGKALLAVFETIGADAANKKNAAETGLIESFRQKLNNSEMQSHIDALPGMRETLEKLYEAHENFISLDVEFIQKSAALESKLSSTALKKQLIFEMNTHILPYLRVMSIAKPDMFAVFSRAVAKSVNRANAVASARRTRRANEKAASGSAENGTEEEKNVAAKALEGLS